MVNYGKLKQPLKQRVLTNPKESRKGKRNKEQTGQIKNSKMVDLSRTRSLVTLNVYGLNTPIKRLRLSD